MADCANIIYHGGLYFAFWHFWATLAPSRMQNTRPAYPTPKSPNFGGRSSRARPAGLDSRASLARSRSRACMMVRGRGTPLSPRRVYAIHTIAYVCMHSQCIACMHAVHVVYTSTVSVTVHRDRLAATQSFPNLGSYTAQMKPLLKFICNV